MDFRGMGFAGDGNLEIILAVAVIWIVAFVFVRTRKALTGKDGNVGDLTFAIVVNIVFALFGALAALVPALIVSGIAIVAYAAVTGQAAHDLGALHAWLLGGAFLVSGACLLWWLRPDRSAV